MKYHYWNSIQKKKCHFDKIRRFGCVSYIKIPKPTLKFGERAIKAVMIGYKPTGYLLWHPSSGKFLESRNVRFNEKLVYKDFYKKNKLDDKNNDAEVIFELDEDKKEKEIPLKPEEKKKRGRPCKSSLEINKQKEVKTQDEISKPLARSQN